jgi:hypothetical protein
VMKIPRVFTVSPYCNRPPVGHTGNLLREIPHIKDKED